MEEKEVIREFIKNMKILLVELEYTDNKDKQIDTVDELYHTAQEFRQQFCD